MSMLTFSPKKLTTNSYAPYWENDSVANPVLVRYGGSRNGDWYDIVLPDGTTKQVHCHTLGVFRTA